MSGLGLEVGLDEVGRGALAGPVVVGAASLSDQGEVAVFLAELLRHCHLREMRDSKQLSARQRQLLFNWLEQRLLWSVGSAEAAEIDRLGLSAALRLAADRALAGLEAGGYQVARVQADAGLFHSRESEIPTERYVRGDENILEISLASVMAKVWRDRLMAELGHRHPAYGFERHVGYGTAAHREAIRLHGLLPEHRRLFLKKEPPQGRLV